MRDFVQGMVILFLLTGNVRSQDLVRYANPLCGTAGKGFIFPGAVAPFGMIQWSPDTGPGIRKGGYSYSDTIVYGFSLDHLSGAGCTYAENFSFLPMNGTARILPPVSRTAFPTSFSHSSEIVHPGYYAVTVGDSVRVELTAGTRAGYGRFKFLSGDTATMVINAASNVRGTTRSSIRIDPLQQSISGSATGGHFCGGPDITTIYFYAQFNRPFSAFGTWSDSSLSIGGMNGRGVQSGAFISFNTSKDRILLVRLAISYVSEANARMNLESEIPDSSFTSTGFDGLAGFERERWNSWLEKIKVTGEAEDLRTFYSMLYHVLLAPTVCSDVNGEYMGYDGQVHTTMNGRIQYANFSGWDIYRSECQLLAMIAPAQASDMAESLLLDDKQGGAFPRWGVPNEESGIMLGDPAAPIIAGFYAFGARDFDTKDAFKALLQAAMDTSVEQIRTGIKERPALGDIMKFGYVPEHPSAGRGSVSMTLEYASADFALSQFAKVLGDSSKSAFLLNRAQSWKNLFNPGTGYLQMRKADGSWAPGFNDGLAIYDSVRGYIEATPSQYVWMVPFDLKELAQKMGGDIAASSRLDTFFTELNGGFNSRYCYIGNEPCLESPWIYSFFGKPYKTQDVVRRIITELFSSLPSGLPGNDDLGEMSSWYVWAAMGMYPELPGSDVLVLGSPLFPNVVLHLKNGEVAITGNGAADDSPYVQSMMINGKIWNKPWIRFADISKGCKLIYELGSFPNKKWGGSVQSAPPSFE